MDAKISGQTVDAQTRYHESYTAMLCEMIEAYFEENSMNVSYCEIEMNKDMDSESYGEIYKICVGIYPKDVLVENDRENTAVQVEKIRVGSEKKAKAEEIVIPEQKWSTWREDLANQFGVDGENVELEICL